MLVGTELLGYSDVLKLVRSLYVGEFVYYLRSSVIIYCIAIYGM